MGDVLCPGCQQPATISIETVEVASIEQFSADERYNTLSNIAQQASIPLATLLVEARNIADSLEEAIPTLETKYNICSVCGKRAK